MGGATTKKHLTTAAEGTTHRGPRCCRHRGLIFPDGGRRCWRHTSYTDRELLWALDGRASRCGFGTDDGGWLRPLERVWPYGPNIDVQMRADMLDWAEAHGLHVSQAAHKCLNWLRRGRCLVVACSATMPPGWFDHVTIWLSDHHRVLVSQPYEVDGRDRAELEALDVEPGLRVEIEPTGWYRAGTLWIAVWADRARSGGRA